jgi:hypothetical protein
MKPLPIWPLFSLFLVTLGIVLAGVLDQAQLRDVYDVVWKDGGAIIAAFIALVAAIWAARPVYRQMQLQNAQAAIALLPLVEGDRDRLQAAVNKTIELWLPLKELEVAIEQKTDLESRMAAFTRTDPIEVVGAITKGLDLSTSQFTEIIRIRNRMAGLIRRANEVYELNNFGDRILNPTVAKGFVEAVTPDLRALADDINQFSAILIDDLRRVQDQIRRLRRAAEIVEH